MNNNKQILSELKNHLDKHYKGDIKNVILFGSQAWGKTNEDSDFDILVVLNKDDYNWQYEKKLRNSIYDIDLQYNIITDNHIISEKELQTSPRRYEPFIINALQNGIYA